MTLIHLVEENQLHGSNIEIRRSDVGHCFSAPCFSYSLCFAQIYLYISLLMSCRVQVDLCDASVKSKANFSVVPFGLISGQLDAVGSTIQANCSFSILCLFSDCQNARMCNQGWVLDEARQISQHCGPSLRCG